LEGFGHVGAENRLPWSIGGRRGNLGGRLNQRRQRGDATLNACSFGGRPDDRTCDPDRPLQYMRLDRDRVQRMTYPGCDNCRRNARIGDHDSIIRSHHDGRIHDHSLTNEHEGLRGRQRTQNSKNAVRQHRR
jgi:hypothetical protein